MLTLAQIKKRLEDRNLREVARRTGLHYNTILGYARGEVKDPPISTAQKLSEYLTEETVH